MECHSTFGLLGESDSTLIEYLLIEEIKISN